MKFKLKYGSAVIALPSDGVTESLKTASRESLAVLIYICRHPDASAEQITDALGITKEQLLGSVMFWQNAGAVELEKGDLLAEAKSATDGKPSSPAGMPRRVMPSAGNMPKYTSEETASFLEGNPGVASLIDCCQQVFGKIFNTAETETVIGMMDYLSLDSDYILLLCENCAGMGKKSLKYVEKMAITLTDRGITSYHGLEKYFEEARRASATEAELRTMLGIGTRELTKKEKDAFSRWSIDWGFTPDAVRLAYGITVDRIGKASPDYIDAILKNWHSAGTVTVGDIERAIAEEKEKRAQKGAGGGTFETDDFFEAALKRSFK